MDAEQRKRIGELYLEMYDKLMVYARANLGSEALAEEAVQETFQIACQKPEDVCGSPNPQGWLVLALRNVVRNIISRRVTAKKAEETYLKPQMEEHAVCEDRLSLNLLYENVAGTEEFKILSEMAVEGKTHEEMALSRHISINASKKRVQRAKEILQKKIHI